MNTSQPKCPTCLKDLTDRSPDQPAPPQSAHYPLHCLQDDYRDGSATFRLSYGSPAYSGSMGAWPAVTQNILELCPACRHWRWLNQKQFGNLIGDLTSAEHWKECQRRIFKTIKPEHLARRFVDEIRKERHDARVIVARFDWERDMSPDDVRWVLSAVQEHFKSELTNCMDNVRAADKSKSRQRRAYERLKSNGCCGYSDVEVPRGDGRTFLIGCNYGH